MKLTGQLAGCSDAGREEPVQEMGTFEKDGQRLEQLGVTLAAEGGGCFRGVDGAACPPGSPSGAHDALLCEFFDFAW
jgi:hypothetical protein